MATFKGQVLVSISRLIIKVCGYNAICKGAGSIEEDHKFHGLFRYYDDLLDNTVLDKKVLDNLISRCILMIEDREEIIKPTTQRERNKILLDILTERPYDTFYLFKDVLKESEPNNRYVQKLVSRMQTTESREEDTCCHYGHEIYIPRIQDEVIPKHILEQFERRLEQWKEDDQQFVSTEAGKHVMQEVLTQSSITLVGKSGIGKSFLSKHIALKMIEDGYTVIPCSKPEDIGKWFKHGRKTLFVFDDVCGRNPFDVFKDQVVQMYGESDAGKMQYCSLVLCVMFNNTLTEEKLSTADKKIGAVIKDLLEECELNKGTSIKRLKKSLETLEGTYVVKEDSTYKIIHDKLFDFMAKYFGEKMLQLFIDHANTDFTGERFLCKITENMGTDIEFVIRIPDKYVNKYIDRLLKDWENGYVNSVCQNRNMNSTTFAEKMVTRLNQLDTSKQAELVCTQDIHDKNIALGGSCFMGSVDLVKWLISRNSDINHCDEAGWFPLLWASQEGHIDVVKELLQHSADGNQCTKADATPLYLASQEGHINVVKELLQHSADVNQCDNDDVSPLYIASENGHVDVVIELLQHSADVNQRTNDDASPLDIASENGHVDVVKELLHHSADVNQCSNENASPLYIASENGHVNIVKELLQHSADLNQCFNDDVSPLFIASENGHVDVVKELLQHSADVNQCSNGDASPLYIASQEGYVSVVKELLQHSVDVNKCYNNGASPLFIASENGHVNIVKELLQHSADVNHCDNDDASPLYIASHNGHVSVVKELLKYSPDVNHCNNNGVSPLYIASENGHVDVVIELLKCSADVNQCDFKVDVNKCYNNGASPLFIASENGHVNIVKELLQHSADVNHCDNDDASPLYIASHNGHVSVVKELLKYSPDVNHCNNNGVSPLYIASENGHVDVVIELLKCSADVNQCDFKGGIKVQKN
ncbi:ankyrin-3-like [Mytilus californianus]|uniref:ankyrin-3-like n=1 Tax=Mytilus californianus TaxID=6549 RepID=UPI0022466BE8|nr:ankyrin-3-like [Mytilus californianus]